jgi:hypothetical protein
MAILLTGLMRLFTDCRQVSFARFRFGAGMTTNNNAPGA